MAMGNIIYAIKEIKPAEYRLIEEQFKQAGRRILWQQFYDGFPTYRHYGVDIGDGSVVHFRGSIHVIQIEAWIQRTGFEEFCTGEPVRLARDVRCAFPPKEIANRALSQVGGDFGGYNFLCNNCEHFANWCANGRRISQQVMFRGKKA